MGDYNFQGLNTRDFEHLIQSLTKKILGNGSITFGDGTDGGREATFEGLGYYHSSEEAWDGYWVIQAKFKQRDNDIDNFLWLKNNFENEMAKFKNFEITGKSNLVPNNYLFFTNVVLTPVLENGVLDKVKKMIEGFKDLIPNISIVGYDDLCRLLDNNRDVATAYSSFIRTGDILEQVFTFFQKKNNEKKNYTNELLRFLYKEFTSDLPSQLRQAGDNTGEKVNLEDVFIDLYASKSTEIDRENQRSPKFLERCILKGNTILRPTLDNKSSNNSMGYTLIGDAGYGKSTLTQFLSQTYRAYFLFNNSNKHSWPQVNQFINQFASLNIKQPHCNRFPFKIILKDYAGWAVENKKKQEPFSVISYFQHRLRVVADIEITKEEIRELLQNLSFLFIFDGLDEVPATSNRSDIIQEINQFVEIDVINNNCDALIVATTRPQGYNNEFNKVNLEMLQLVPLSNEECRKYIIKIVSKFSDDPDQVSRLSKILFKALEDDTVSKLMETPLQATIMAFLVRMGGEPPRNKFDLFSNYVNTMITREQQKGVVEVINDLTHHIKTIHNKLGYFLQKGSEQENNPSSNMSEEKFREFIVDYLLDELGYEDDRVKVIADNIMEAIEGRLAFITKTTDTSVGFSVRSLQEYFAAMYIMTHQGDAEVKNSLSKISSSSYWRKSFLFAVGYMTRQRADMIGYLIELCREMNGEDIELGKENVKSIAVLGSWLALDIINDGVLNTFPKYENMLSRLLEELFRITPQYSHRYLGNLPQRVIERTVVPLIKKYIINNEQNIKLTSITNLFYIINHKNNFYDELIELVELNWPKDNEEIFIELLLKNDFDNNWFIHKLFDSIKTNTNNYLLYQNLYSNDFGNVYPKLIEISNKNKESKGILLKNIFLGLLTKRSYRVNYVELIKQFFYEDINSHLNNDNLNNFEKFIDRISYEIYGKYEAMGESVFKSNRELFSFILNNFYDVNEKENFVSSYCNFIIEPNNKNLIEFFKNLINEDEFVFDRLKESSAGLNWVMNNIFKEHKSKEELPLIIKELEQGVYADAEQWEHFEDELKNTNEVAIHALPKLSWRYVQDDDKHFLKMYDDIYGNINFNSPEDKIIMEREILRAFSYIDLNSSTENLFSTELLEEIYNIFIRNINIPYGQVLNILIRLVILMSPQQILKLIMNTNHLNINFSYNITLEDTHLVSGFIKLCDILFPLKMESSLIRILPPILFSVSNNDQFKQINFKYLREIKYDDHDNETCRILLCVYDHIINNNNPKIEELIISRYLDDPKILNYVINIFENSKNQLKSIEPIFYSIYKQIDKSDLCNQDLLFRYESFIKEAFENVVTS